MNVIRKSKPQHDYKTKYMLYKLDLCTRVVALFQVISAESNKKCQMSTKNQYG